jgi:GxxExxY protein
MKPKPHRPILPLHSQEASRWSVATPDITPNADLTYRIIGFAMRVHRRLGPGLLESIYERCLSHELDRAEIPHICQAPLSVNYDGVDLPCAYRADITVHDQVVLEIKSVDRLGPLHEAQLLTYLRLSGCRIGLLLNFNTVSLTDGLRRCVL